VLTSKVMIDRNMNIIKLRTREIEPPKCKKRKFFHISIFYSSAK
jgi:hypothetical protein